MICRDSAKTAHKGKCRSLFGRVGRVFRRLFCIGKKKKDLRDSEEINVKPPETTRCTEHVHESDHAVLPRKKRVPLTTQKESTEDMPHPSGGYIQHGQHNVSPRGKRRFFFRKINVSLPETIRKDASKGTNEIQAHVPVPLTVESFKYHKLLGEGMYGKVYLASHPDTDQLLAIKKVKTTSVLFEKLLAERQNQEMMGGNRFFPELYATFQTKEYLFYVMEFVNGWTLPEFKVKMHPLDINTIRFIAAEILCAIQALHSRGIVHRDLHSKNILIDGNGHVKIIDFGLSEKKGAPFNVNTTTIPYARAYRCSVCLGKDRWVLADIGFAGPADWLPLQPTGKNHIQAFEKPWIDYLREYSNFQRIVMHLSSNDYRHPLLQCLLEECNYVQRNLRHHPFFAGIDWKKLEAGNLHPPYVMPPNPEVNQAKRIRVNGKHFMKNIYRTKDVPGFDFVDQWREMLQHR